MIWKLVYDAQSIGKSGEFWIVGDAPGAVDEVCTVEDAPNRGVLTAIYRHPRVGRRVSYLQDWYLYQDGEWWMGDETMLFGAIERGLVPGVALSGNVHQPFVIDDRLAGWSGLLTHMRSTPTIIKRGVYVSEAKMQRALILSQNDPDLPAENNGPPDPAWSQAARR